MNKRILYVMIVLFALLAFAGWTRVWSLSTSTEITSAIPEIDQSGVVLDYHEDAKIFIDRYTTSPNIESPEQILDYRKDGEFYITYFVNE